MVDAKKCPECNSSKLIYDETRGELICGSCGLLVEEKMVDTTQEWREFDSEGSEKRRRAGAPSTKSEMAVARLDASLSIAVSKA